LNFVHFSNLLKPLRLGNWFYFRPWFESSFTEGLNTEGFLSYPVQLKAEIEPISETAQVSVK
jgi:hypothetical protein